jgi:DNA recombination protein RmuC
VAAYNPAVGSLESRVLPSARRLSELGVVDGELPVPAPVEETTRALSAPELAAPELAAPELAGRELVPGPGDADAAGMGPAEASLVRAARCRRPGSRARRRGDLRARHRRDPSP